MTTEKDPEKPVLATVTAIDDDIDIIHHETRVLKSCAEPAWRRAEAMVQIVYAQERLGTRTGKAIFWAVMDLLNDESKMVDGEWAPPAKTPLVK